MRPCIGRIIGKGVSNIAKDKVAVDTVGEGSLCGLSISSVDHLASDMLQLYAEEVVITMGLRKCISGEICVACELVADFFSKIAAPGVLLSIKHVELLSGVVIKVMVSVFPTKVMEIEKHYIH